MTLTVITPPAGEPLSLNAAKAFLRLAHDGEDTLVTDLIASARAQIEQASGLALVTRSLRRAWTRWPSALGVGGIRLSPGPVTGLAAVKLVDADGNETDHTGRFQLISGRLCLRPWSVVPSVPTGGQVQVEFEAGFGAPEDVPDDLVFAVKRMLQIAYDQLEQGTARLQPGLPEDVEALLDARRGARL